MIGSNFVKTYQAPNDPSPYNQIDWSWPFTGNGATYNVESKAEWIDDATGGTDSCSNSGSKASYIRMTSTVRASTSLTRPRR